MDIKNLIIGILLLIFGIGLLFYDNDYKEKTGMLKAIQTNLNLTRVGMIIIGIVVIFLELNKII